MMQGAISKTDVGYKLEILADIFKKLADVVDLVDELSEYDEDLADELGTDFHCMADRISSEHDQTEEDFEQMPEEDEEINWREY